MSRLLGDHRKDSIVQAAMPLFARKGFKGTTTKDIARCAEVSEALIYKHFPTKELLFQEIQANCCLKFTELAALFNTIEDSLSGLRMVVQVMAEVILDEGASAGPSQDRRIFHRLMLQSVIDDGDFAREFFRQRSSLFINKIEACLRKASLHYAATLPVDLGAQRSQALFCHNVLVMTALHHLPDCPVVDYQQTRAGIIASAVKFCLGGLGVPETDAMDKLSAGQILKTDQTSSSEYDKRH
jgi:AcrR family transcriptional regulator